MPQLIAVEGPLAGKVFNLQDSTVLGRSFDADIRIDDLTVSRHHAKVEKTPQGRVVEDLGSGNGTQVNDATIESATPLKDGDLIKVSKNVFRYSEKGESRQAGGGGPDLGVDLVSFSDTEGQAVEKLDVKATMMNLSPAQVAADPAAARKAHERLRTVVAISNDVQQQLDLDQLLQKILDSLFHVFTQADRGFIMLKDDTGALAPRASKERGKDKPGNITVSQHVIDDVEQHCIAILTADAMGDDRYAGAQSIMDFKIRSMMCAPLLADEQFLGIIHIDTVQQDKRFTMDDLDLLTGVANQTAFAIANAKLHQKLMKQQRMQRDMQLARQVQESFLPGAPPEVEGFDLVARYKAALDVGGDFYDFIPLDDGRLVIGLGDVAGKGVPAALLMARMSSDMRQSALIDKQAGTVLTRMNTRLCGGATESPFVTAIVMTLDPAAKKLSISNAAHCLPVVRRRSGEVLEIDEGGSFPLGALDDNQYEEGGFQLEPGDVVSIFSDGIVEAMNATRELYGTERLLAAVARPASTAREVMDNILKDVAAWVKDTPPSDDLTLVCIGVK